MTGAGTVLGAVALVFAGLLVATRGHRVLPAVPAGRTPDPPAQAGLTREVIRPGRSDHNRSCLSRPGRFVTPPGRWGRNRPHRWWPTALERLHAPDQTALVSSCESRWI